MWELDYKESWVLKNWCFWTVVLEKTLESPLDWKEIQPVHPKGDQSWVFIGRTDAEAETPILWPPDVKNWLIWTDPDAGKNWGQKEEGTTEDEMVGWHHWLNGNGFGWTLGVGEGQGGLLCCRPWGLKESYMTEWLSWTELNWSILRQLSSVPVGAGHWAHLFCLSWITVSLTVLMLSFQSNIKMLHLKRSFFFHSVNYQIGYHWLKTEYSTQVKVT